MCLPCLIMGKKKNPVSDIILEITVNYFLSCLLPKESSPFIQSHTINTKLASKPSWSTRCQMCQCDCTQAVTVHTWYQIKKPVAMSTLEYFFIIFFFINETFNFLGGSKDCSIKGIQYIWMHSKLQAGLLFVAGLLCTVIGTHQCQYWSNILLTRTCENTPWPTSSNSTSHKTSVHCL